jgi:hypothetical protein
MQAELDGEQLPVGFAGQAKTPYCGIGFARERRSIRR